MNKQEDVGAGATRSTPAPPRLDALRAINDRFDTELCAVTRWDSRTIQIAEVVGQLRLAIAALTSAAFPAVEAPPPNKEFCKEDEHSFGPCKTCGMPHLASRLESPTADDIAWAARSIHDENISATGSDPEAVHYGQFDTCDAPSCAAVRAAATRAAVPPGAADARTITPPAINKLLIALTEDAAGVPVWELLRTCAEQFNAAGGGPLADRCSLMADALEFAVGVAPAAPRDEMEQK